MQKKICSLLLCMICMLPILSFSAFGYDAVFTDVPADAWEAPYVYDLVGRGILSGYGDGTFGPDDTVKYEQAVTMIMRTLGYDPFAANNGGYPTGYLAAAQRYGVT